ncbi:hypothetical protein CDAR_278051 [Caerostris darwini]|uniref:Uncharacterized protein n=1 Tax=Caerostris darwini TaxID=1538125 RepID=A0AAV4S6Z8_9ARAC|nr:hypothetical protein CDAR_278051 [Caerostris darwini]
MRQGPFPAMEPPHFLHRRSLNRISGSFDGSDIRRRPKSTEFAIGGHQNGELIKTREGGLCKNNNVQTSTPGEIRVLYNVQQSYQ